MTELIGASRNFIIRWAFIAGVVGVAFFVMVGLFFMRESDAYFRQLASEHVKILASGLANQADVDSYSTVHSPLEGQAGVYQSTLRMFEKAQATMNFMIIALCSIAAIFFAIALIGYIRTKTALIARAVAERGREEALKRFEAAIAYTPLVAVQALSPNGKIALWNRASEQLYGYSPEEVIGKDFSELCLVEVSRLEFRADLERAYGTCHSGSAKEWTIFTKSGEERRILSTLVPIVEEGLATEVFCMQLDISKETAVRCELEASLGRIKAYYDMMVGRELRVVELKHEINELCDRLEEARHYGV